MQTAMQRTGSRTLAVLIALAAAVVVLGPTGPASAAADGRIGPGTQLVTGGHTCTASFVFRDARKRVYLGYAASCATGRAATAGNPCAARPLALGTTVRLVDRGRSLGRGELSYSSLRALQRAGVTDAATCAANDFALVRISGALRDRVTAAMPYWGGPTGIAGLPASGTNVFGVVRPSSGARVLPRAGQVTMGAGATATVSTPFPSGSTALGSGFLDAAGRAVGILTAASATGDNTVVSLADAVAFARAHGMAGLRVLHGPGFSGSAVL
jgi:hypothetical protein